MSETAGIESRGWQRLLTVDRGVWLQWAGACGLLIGACLNWLTVPSGALSSISASGEVELLRAPHWTEWLSRAVVFVAALFVLKSLCNGRTEGRRLWVAGWIAVAAVFGFPCWSNQWAVSQTMDGRVLFNEINRVVSDMENEFYEQQTDWRQSQRFSVNFIGGMPMRVLEPSVVGMDLFVPRHLYELFQANGYGFSETFTGFIGRGMVLALFAAPTLILGLMLGPNLSLSRRCAELRRGGALIALALAIPLVPRFVGEGCLVWSDQRAHAGDYATAHRALQWAAVCKPDLQCQWWYFSRLGNIERLFGQRQSVASLLSEAYTDAKWGRSSQALMKLFEAERVTPTPAAHPFLQTALALAWAEAGVHEFERGQFSLAEEHWRSSLQYRPISPTAWYGLAQCALRVKDFPRALHCYQQVVRLQEPIYFKSLTVESQSHFTESWAAFQARDWPRAHEAYSLALQPDKW